MSALPVLIGRPLRPLVVAMAVLLPLALAPCAGLTLDPEI
jgi:hypothetical protein